ncbi:MAG: DUF2914 domain-containing protein [Thermodesulfobacteriota bacterium]
MKSFLVLLAFLILTSIPLSVRAESNTSVETAVLGTGVENLVPMGVAESFSASIGRVYCYSKITNGDGSTITHRWYYNDKEVAAVHLEIRSTSFRTYSYKTILPHYKGNWKVEIVAEEGNIMKTLEFTIE